ncbi:MAG: carboxypeptidase-like regulatory domain-containing protein [Bacteroidia bacterium]
MRFHYLLLFLLLSLSAEVFSQIELKGKITDVETGAPLPYSFVIINRTQNGVFADTKGEYSIKVIPGDSLLFSLTGYQFTKLILSDTLKSSPLVRNIQLKLKPVKLREFQVKAPKTFDQILAELEKAEKSKVSHRTEVSSAIESPITFLYMQFSREGKSIRKISELRAEDEKQALLKDLFTRYMIAHIIDLDETDMDDFIAFSGLKQNYNMFETEYELVVYVKKRHSDYKRYRGIE